MTRLETIEMAKMAAQDCHGSLAYHVITRLIDQYENLARYAEDLYMSGHWTCDRQTELGEDELWNRLKWALDLPDGSSPAPVNK